MAAFNFRRRKTRRGWYAGATLVVAAFFTVFYVVGATADTGTGCDFAPTGTTASCVGPVGDSTFAGGDGNLLTNPTTYGTTDWQNVSGLNPGVDLASGSGDNSLGQGTKEDNAAVTVVSGSIPPQKSDLTRFYEASELINNQVYIYLAWERTNNLGSANMDFEINQNSNGCPSVPGSCTISRTAGDVLVTFDFTNGGGRPTLGLLKWLTAANGNTASQCFSSNSLPCWGSHVTLNGTDSEGAVNNLGTVTDPIAPNAPRTLTALTFGEAAINLTAAGVINSSNGCSFGSASTFLKSRSSSSFPAEVKDFVAPVSTPLFTNCGALKVTKTSSKTGNALAGAHFTITHNGTPISQTPVAGYFTTDSNGVICVDGLAAPADYVVTETAPPTGFAIDTPTGQTVSVAANGATCSDSTYTGASKAFTDSPKSDIQVNFKDDGSGETNGSGTTISCDNGTNGTTSTSAATGWQKSVTVTGIKTGSTDTVIHCTITIDP
jgi:Prealbumin-like fold domain